MIKKKLHRGFSLVELVIAMGLFIFIFATGFVVIKSLFQSSYSSSLQSKVNEKLRTVAAMIQNEAATSFDTLEETGRDRTGFRDPGIVIHSTITAISSVDRTRTVFLEARYEVSPGNFSVKNMQFTLSNSLGGFSGSGVKVTVTSQFSDSPVQGVYVYAPGQNLTEVSGVTDINGMCVLYGVKIGDPASRVTLSGQGVNAYFPFPANTAASYLKTIDAFNLTEGNIRDLGSFDIVLPGHATVRLLDVTSNNPVQNAEIRIYPKQGQVPIGTTIAATLGGGLQNGFVGITNNSGIATFSNYVPGNYYVLVLGNSEYAAVDKEITFPLNSTLRTPLSEIRTEQTSNWGDVYTIKKGSINMRISGIDHDDSSFIIEDGLTEAPSIQFLINDDVSYRFTSSPGYALQNTFHWSNSLARNYVTQGYTYYGVTLDKDGKGQLPFFAPKIVEGAHMSPSSSEAERQAVIATPYAGFMSGGRFMTPKPYAPILVNFMEDDLKKPRFLIGLNGVVKVSPPTATADDFNIKIFTNGETSENSNFTYGLLKVSDKTMASAEGYVVGIAGNAQASFAGTALYSSTVKTVFGMGPYGSGGITSDIYGDANNNSGNNYWVESQLWVSTTREPYLGDFREHWVFPKRIIPTLEGQTQGFVYSGYPSGVTMSNQNFFSNVVIYTKDSSGNTIQEASPTSGATLAFRVKYYQTNVGYATEAPDVVNAQIVNGTLSFTHTAGSVDYFSAMIPAMEMEPNSHVVFPDVTVRRTSSRRSYFVSMISDASQQLDFVRPPGWLFAEGYPFSFPEGGTQYECPMTMTFYRRGVTHLTGRVVDIAGRGIERATVVLRGEIGRAHV